MEINKDNVYDILQVAIGKLSELSEYDRRMTVEYAKWCNWSDECIDFGIANGMIIPPVDNSVE